jgi:hypothetical protein
VLVALRIVNTGRGNESNPTKPNPFVGLSLQSAAITAIAEPKTKALKHKFQKRKSFS